MYLERLEIVVPATIVLYIFANYVRHLLEGRHPFPPGPRRLPFVGSLLEMPKESAWLKAAKWRKEYGEYSGQLARG